MVLRVVGILTLLYCPLSVLCSDSLLLQVNIITPNREGRQVCQDILDIESALCQASGIQVYQARKTLDNQKVILDPDNGKLKNMKLRGFHVEVLEVKDTSKWSSLADALSKQGYELSVTPLQTCKEYAKELGLNVDYFQPSTEKDTLINSYALEFYDQGMSTDNYMDVLIQHFKGNRKIIRNGTINAECYRYYGDLPVQLMYLGPVLNAADLNWVYSMVRDEGKASLDYNLLQNFQSFTEVC